MRATCLPQEIELDLQYVRNYLARGYQQPFLLLDSDIIRANARRFMDAMPRVKPHFAVKSNPDQSVLETLREEGVGFEIASKAELDQLLRLGVAGREIFYSNPLKSRDYLQYAANNGIEWYVVDAVEELHKVHAIKPDAKLYLRIYTSNEGSGWPLSSKFGAHEEEVVEIITEAARIGADLAGVTFHVGSQCLNLNNWRIGLRASRQVFDQMLEAGLKPRLLNLGGGYPVLLSEPIPDIEEIGQVINEELTAFPDDVKVIAEPGRYMVADSGYFICRVVGTATRKGKRWLYLDAGVYGGLTELKDGLDFTLHTDRQGELTPWTVAGPTCDSVDVCIENQLLPSDLQEGDFVYIKNAGAYTTACSTTFNGFPQPRVVLV